MELMSVAKAGSRVLRGVALAGALALGPVAAQAAQPDPSEMTQQEVNDALFADPEIFNTLLIAATIYHIVEICDELLPPNRLTRTVQLLGLYQRARAKGYSHEQLETFVEDEGQQERMRAIVYRYAEQNGARPENREDICALGRAEIAANSPVGRRLSER